MNKVKEPDVANIFYTADKEKLISQLNGFKSKNIYEYKTRATIVPHAGYFYSGELAYQGISQLDKNIKNIFIFAPSHKTVFEGLALSTYEEWKTPLGNIKLNQDINKELERDFSAKFFDEAYKDEHSIEIQVPIIQNIFQDVKVIPVLISMENFQTISDIIEKYYPDKECGFIISSDLSHFLTDENAKKLDNITAQMIETGNINNFNHEQACGTIGVCGLVHFANKFNYSLIRINMYNSSRNSNDKSRVVGYGCWMLFEGSKNYFIKKYYSDYMLKLCRDIILNIFDNKKIITNHTSVFDESGACFVTLKKQNRLRGCIGSIIAHQPLINDLIQHSQDAAFHDPRFNPLKKEEIDDITIDISLLSNPKQITFDDEKDLLNQIVPYKDGIIIKDGKYQAVYLPSVWEELEDKEIFLQSLKMKAGLAPDYFSKTFQAYRFYTEYIEQN